MTAKAHFTERDQAILQALSLQVRVFGQRQLANMLWQGDVANARRRIRRFVELGLVERKVTLARPLPEILGPVFTWHPGQSDPDMGRLAFQLQSRWRYRRLRSTVLIIATSNLIDHFGGRHKTMMAAQLSHDLGVAEVWLWFFCNRPDLAKRWRGENQLTEREPGETVPDAVLVDDREQPMVLIEFGGDYGTDRLAAFHDDAAAKGMPYQVW